MLRALLFARCPASVSVAPGDSTINHSAYPRGDLLGRRGTPKGSHVGGCPSPTCSATNAPSGRTKSGIQTRFWLTGPALRGASFFQRASTSARCKITFLTIARNPIACLLWPRGRSSFLQRRSSPPTDQAGGLDITPWVGLGLGRNFQFGAARLGAVLTRVNGEFLGIRGLLVRRMCWNSGSAVRSAGHCYRPQPTGGLLGQHTLKQPATIARWNGQEVTSGTKDATSVTGPASVHDAPHNIPRLHIPTAAL
jgi:hypothetical protein